MAFLAVFSAFSALAEAKVYIDITSPQRALPIAVEALEGPSGEDISDIVEADLEFTGLFRGLDRAAFIEGPDMPFKSENWRFLGAEAVVKGTVKIAGGELKATVSLYDVFEGREVLKKNYQSDKELLRPLAHTIAGDIYRYVTGAEPVFRTKVAFITEKDGAKRLGIMDWDGHRITPLGISAPLILTPHWRPDGNGLLYSSERKRQWGIYLLDIDRGREKLLYTSNGTNIAGNFFPDGKTFVFSSSKDGTPDIYTFDFSKNELLRLTATRGIEVSPSVSPDGQWIAHVSDRAGSPQIYLIDKNGYNIVRLTYESSYNTSPAWSADGAKIVFVRRWNGKNQIFTMNKDGTDVVRLTEAGNNEEPSFSPDGRYIVFTSDREGIKGIYLMRANGEAQRRITPSGQKAGGPKWSPKQ